MNTCRDYNRLNTCGEWIVPSDARDWGSLIEQSHTQITRVNWMKLESDIVWLAQLDTLKNELNQYCNM